MPKKGTVMLTREQLKYNLNLFLDGYDSFCNAIRPGRGINSLVDEFLDSVLAAPTPDENVLNGKAEITLTVSHAGATFICGKGLIPEWHDKVCRPYFLGIHPSPSVTPPVHNECERRFVHDYTETCSDCEHTVYVHPGYYNPKLSMCFICAVEATR